MSYSLQVVDSSTLPAEEVNELDQKIASIIEKHKNNRYMVNRLVFESTAALTASDNLAREKASQGILKRFWNGLTGKNSRMQADIDRNLARAQYASQQTLQKLAEQNVMSFELISAVNNKLNSSLITIDKEINNIYGTMLTFFKQSRSDILQLETRVDRLEKNVNILNWQNAIEYQMYKGTEYSELDDITKMVCLIHDFYNLTKGEWTTSDLLLLKTAMATIDLSPRGKIDYSSFIRKIGSDPELYDYLVSSELQNVKAEPEYELLMAGVNKIRSLESDEGYIVDAATQLLTSHGIQENSSDIAYQLMETYVSENQTVNLKAEVNNFEFIMDVLYNLEQLKETKAMRDKYTYAKRLFLDGLGNEAEPLLEELASMGVWQAKYLLANMYIFGLGMAKNKEKGLAWAKEAAQEGDARAKALYLNSLEGKEYRTQAAQYKKELTELADAGDMFAQQELGVYYINEKDGEKADFSLAQHYFELSAKQGFARGYNSSGRSYQNGRGVKKDLSLAIKYFTIAFNKSMLAAAEDIGDIYLHGGEGVEAKPELMIEWYKKSLDLKHISKNNDGVLSYIGYYYKNELNDIKEALKYWQIGEKVEGGGCLSNLGCAYMFGQGVSLDYSKALDYFKRAFNERPLFSTANEPIERHHDGYTEARLGDLYYNGWGTAEDKNAAKEWYVLAAKDGDETAKKSLKEKFGIDL